jgi:hypothetical protein
MTPITMIRKNNERATDVELSYPLIMLVSKEVQDNTFQINYSRVRQQFTLTVEINFSFCKLVLSQL